MPAMKLGQMLIGYKLCSPAQVEAGLAEQQKWGGKIGEILVRMGALSEENLIRVLAKQLNVQPVNLDAVANLAPQLLAKVPGEKARAWMVVPVQLKDEGRTLVVVTAEPQALATFDAIRVHTGLKVATLLSGKQAIARAHAKFYVAGEDVPADSGEFKMVDAQNATVMKPVKELQEQLAREKAAAPAPAPAGAAAGAGPRTEQALQTLKSLEEAQKKELAALKAIVELMLEKGVFTRDEYLAKVKR
ncbi:MAG: general secretion pathway protein GspE [Deltaproteobacteria bacterium]|nr:general secretion pathway protein GspE [Deltaproteobacteria bacterium]